MQDCIFCKIVKGDVPCYKIYEDKDIIAFLDIANDVPGHTLVLPKKHVLDLDDCDEILYKKVMLTCKKISRHYLKKGFEGVNLVSNCKPCSGQEVSHFHVHIIPRKENDGAKLDLTPANKKENLEKLVKKLRIGN